MTEMSNLDSIDGVALQQIPNAKPAIHSTKAAFREAQSDFLALLSKIRNEDYRPTYLQSSCTPLGTMGDEEDSQEYPGVLRLLPAPMLREIWKDSFHRIAGL